MRKEIHVVSNPDGGWDAKRPNADRASKHFETKKEAMDWGRNLAKKEGAELIPHGRMVRFRILIVMVMTLALQKTGNIKVI
nr:DUF2188 domain-containing protein [Segatella maculosa]